MVSVEPLAARSRFSLSRLGLPLLVLGAGLLCTTLAAVQLKSSVDEAEIQRFETLAGDRLDVISDRLETYIALLRGTAGLFSSTDIVTAQQFSGYVDRLRLPELYPGIRGIGFARGFAAAARDAVAAETGARGVTTFRIVPEGERDYYSSIVLLAPRDARNDTVLGLDMYAEPVRRAAMERARDTGLRAMSGKVSLDQETQVEKQAGFLLYLPIYGAAGGRVPATLEERRANLLGWIYSPFRADDFFSRALDSRGRTPELEIAIYDGEAVTEDRLMFRSSPAGSRHDGRYATTRRLDIAEHQWTFAFENTDAFLPDANRLLIPAVAGGGMLMTLLLAAAALIQTRATAAAENAREQLREMNLSLEGRVEERTAELENARSAMETLNRNLETIVQTRTEDLTAANDEIQRFAYIVSHDLRSPLVNVMGFTSELQVARKVIAKFYENVVAREPEAVSEEVRTAIETELPEAIEFIRSSTAKMDRLINAILKLSRQGGRVLTPEPLKMKTLLEGTAQTLAHQATEAGAEILIEDIPDLVGDRLALEQIFTNLLENAVKYLAPGRPGRIRVRGWQEGPIVSIDVEDNGRGIDPKDHSRVFDLFRRAGAQDRPGEGIGLAHVRALVRRLGGTITLNSIAGEGSTFRVSLPSIMSRIREGEV